MSSPAREETIIGRRSACGATGGPLATHAAGRDAANTDYRKEVVVHKRPLVVEEITISKRILQDTQKVSDTIRREEARTSSPRRRVLTRRLKQYQASQAKGDEMATFQELAEQNPNIRQQYDEWREQRAQNGEDPTDYQAFRQHVIALGAPDPGEQEIDDFVGDDFKAAHPERYSA
jgi:hypothetical protein